MDGRGIICENEEDLGNGFKGLIAEKDMFAFCKKLMPIDSDLGEDHFPEFSLIDTTEYLVRLAN